MVAVCKEHFSWGSAWDDPRVALHIEDGAAFVRSALPSSYDVIIQDSSDPWTWTESGEKVELPSSVLYSKEHMENIHRALKPNGVLNIQAETLQLPSDLQGVVSWRQGALDAGFATARYSTIMIPTYPTGQIGCLLCEKSKPGKSLQQKVLRRYLKMCEAGLQTSYYHPRLQTSSFDLPLWAEKQIYGTDGDPYLSCGKDEYMDQ